MKSKEYLTERVSPFLNKIKTMKKNVKIIHCDIAGENKNLEENCAFFFNKLTLNLLHQAIHGKMTQLDWYLLHFICGCTR